MACWRVAFGRKLGLKRIEFRAVSVNLFAICVLALCCEPVRSIACHVCAVLHWLDALIYHYSSTHPVYTKRNTSCRAFFFLPVGRTVEVYSVLTCVYFVFYFTGLHI